VPHRVNMGDIGGLYLLAEITTVILFDMHFQTILNYDIAGELVVCLEHCPQNDAIKVLCKNSNIGQILSVHLARARKLSP
jgi:hypothetical protein